MEGGGFNLVSNHHMHRCLLVPDILRAICAHISVRPDSTVRMDVYNPGEARRDLLAMTLVCHNFYNPSLDQLWREIDGLYPLLTGLPPDIWSEPLTRRNVVLSRAITPSDLGPFRALANRVQVYHDVRHDPRYDANVPIAVYQALSFYFRDQPIFPNLVEIFWRCSGNEAFSYIPMFLGPDVRRIRLNIFGNSITQNSMLPTLTKRCPSLTHFHLCTPERQSFPDVGRQMKYLLSQWSQLETLTVHYLSKESLRIVAGLPRLRSLTLSYADDVYGDTFSPAPGTKVFPVLRNLSITANSPVLCINLLKAATNCPLTTFEFSLFGSNPPVWHDLFATLVKSCDKSTLTTIRIDDLAVEHGQHGPSTTDELRILFPLTGLTNILLQIHYGFNINDAFMGEMAAAWPHIHTLVIKVTDIIQQSQQLTLHGLAPLAELCPKLHILGIHVNATHICSNHLDLYSDSKSCVEVISVGHSPISETSVPWATAYLSAIFPKLRGLLHDDCIIGQRSEWSEDAVRWLEVNKHLAGYRHVSGRRRNGLRCSDCELNAM
ncbi:hypothetical protein BD779DRAFT_1672896 [Infundibulicybe gibba]|nr:hypothetical protein BD779DRAFT_1672896 [Infundibulicybe gibba]